MNGSSPPVSGAGETCGPTGLGPAAIPVVPTERSWPRWPEAAELVLAPPPSPTARPRLGRSLLLALAGVAPLLAFGFLGGGRGAGSYLVMGGVLGGVFGGTAALFGYPYSLTPSYAYAAPSSYPYGAPFAAPFNAAGAVAASPFQAVGGAFGGTPAAQPSY